MKKTIAILLVLVIGMVGVWAANDATADMKLTTEIAEIFKIFVTASDTALTEAEWLTYTQQDVTKDVDSTYTNQFKSVANVQARSNNSDGFTINVKASSLYSPTTEAIIKYQIKIGTNGTAVSSHSTLAGYGADLSSVTSTVSATIEGTGSLITINEAINVQLDATDYANAGAAEDYDAKIYLEYVAV